jgi:putative membrane protein
VRRLGVVRFRGRPRLEPRVSRDVSSREVGIFREAEASRALLFVEGSTRGRGVPGPIARGGRSAQPKGETMRYVQAILLLAFLGAVTVFAFQNMQMVKISFVNWGLTAPFALVIVAIYFLGMVSGWTVVAFVQRSVRRVTERREG